MGTPKIFPFYILTNYQSLHTSYYMHVTDVSPTGHRSVTDKSPTGHRCVTDWSPTLTASACHQGVTVVSPTSHRCHRFLLTSSGFCN